jgi:PASTA domain-containing protein
MAAAIRLLLAVGFAGLLASGTLAFGAERAATTPRGKPAAPPPPTILLVPDVRGKAYIFAKGMLEEDGFAWRVEGSVRGYAANSIAGQSPAPGTKVVDTGAPTVTLRLSRTKGYKQLGDPEGAAPYPGTEIQLKRKPGDR